MSMLSHYRTALTVLPHSLALVVATAMVVPAHAGERELLPANTPKAYIQECASCHTAFPPSMLPGRSWARVISGLDKHYGTDASLDPDAARQLSQWLQANAGTYKRMREEPPQDRITRSAWFQRKHRKIDPAAWSHASVKTAANCAACHSGADRGNYDDGSLRFPAGLEAQHRRAWHG